MKKILFSVFIILSALLASCSIYEEIHFKENGYISYNMTVDMSEMLRAMPNSKRGEIPIQDSTVSLGEILQERINVDRITSEEKELIRNLSSLYITSKFDSITNSGTISLYGDFVNDKALNETLLALNEVAKQSRKDTLNMGKAKMFDGFQNYSLYSWDGKMMQRTSQPKQITRTGSNEGGGDSLSDLNLMSFFSGGKMTVKYHFHSKVKEVSDPEALSSFDGKTVIIDYPGSVFFEEPDKTNITIQIE